MKELTEQMKDGALYIFYLNKLVEFGLIEGNDYSMTLKGFELAYDLYEEGHKLTEEFIREFGTICLGEETPKEVQMQISELMTHMQDVGFKEMKKELTKLK